MCQQSASGELYHEFDIVFRKTNKDPTKGMIQCYCIKDLVSNVD